MSRRPSRLKDPRPIAERAERWRLYRKRQGQCWVWVAKQPLDDETPAMFRIELLPGVSYPAYGFKAATFERAHNELMLAIAKARAWHDHQTMLAGIGPAILGEEAEAS